VLGPAPVLTALSVEGSMDRVYGQGLWMTPLLPGTKKKPRNAGLDARKVLLLIIAIGN
jgi:hypothetical protein